MANISTVLFSRIGNYIFISISLSQYHITVRNSSKMSLLISSNLEVIEDGYTVLTVEGTSHQVSFNVLHVYSLIPSVGNIPAALQMIKKQQIIPQFKTLDVQWNNAQNINSSSPSMMAPNPWPDNSPWRN